MTTPPPAANQNPYSLTAVITALKCLALCCRGNSRTELDLMVDRLSRGLRHAVVLEINPKARFPLNVLGWMR